MLKVMIISLLIARVASEDLIEKNTDELAESNPDVETALPEKVDDATGTIQNYLGVSCPAGHRCLPVLECLPCDYGSYKVDVGSSLCSRCPAGCTTLRKGATSWRECVAKCPEGYEEEASTCTKCAAGSYKSSWDNVPCTPCPNTDYDRSLVGLVSESHCYTSSSTFSVTSTTPVTTVTTKDDNDSTYRPTSQGSSPETTYTLTTTEATTQEPTDTTTIIAETTLGTTGDTTPSHSTVTPPRTDGTPSSDAPTGVYWTQIYGKLNFTLYNSSEHWENLTIDDLHNPDVYYGVTWMAHLLEVASLVAEVDILSVSFTADEEGGIEAQYIGEFYVYGEPGAIKPVDLTEACKQEVSDGNYGVYDIVRQNVNVNPASIYHGYYYEQLPDEQLQMNGCPVAGCSGVQYYSHDPCDKFCQCNYGGWEVQDCAPGTLFSNAVGVCDHKNNVECNA